MAFDRTRRVYADRSMSGTDENTSCTNGTEYILWEIGKTVHQYVDRVFEAGILCLFKEQPNDAPERTR